MASYATATSTAGRVMSVLLDGGSARTRLRVGTVATEAELVSSITHYPRVVIPVRIMAAEARSCYSINSSAVANSVSGMVSPSALAVLRLMTNSNRIDCTTGRSAGLAPLRMLPV
jgi:hypothetical protein